MSEKFPENAPTRRRYARLLRNHSDAIERCITGCSECPLGISAVRRNHDLSEDELDGAEQAWEEYWAASRPVELTAAVERHAGQLARAHALRGAGAVHLASALAIGDPDLVIAVWDRRLHTGARAAGVRVAPAHLDPASPAPQAPQDEPR